MSDFFGSTSGCKRKFDEMECRLREEKLREEKLREENKGAIKRLMNLARVNPVLHENMGYTWFKALEEEFHKEYFDELTKTLCLERWRYIVYPQKEDVYSWTFYCVIEEVKVVILGQDPYHRPGQANGLAFSVPKDVAVPPSLKNIYAEIKSDVGGSIPNHGDLYNWAKQGVVLLNTCLTVRAGKPKSHRFRGWEEFTDAVITWINDNLSNVVFMLWGKDAQLKETLIDEAKHLILTAPHPSPLSVHRGFFGCRHFSKANAYLKAHNKKCIDWNNLDYEPPKRSVN